jgi:hypothetical protein
MTQAERNRLVTIRKAEKRVITQGAAAAELELSVRQIQRLLDRLRTDGDKGILHALRGRISNRRIDETVERRAVKVLSMPVYRGFGPTLAAEYLRDKHGMGASRETVRQWMMRAQLWRGRKEKLSPVHLWRPRHSRFGELVQWDTSEHDWLEKRGEKLYLIAMIDDATSRLWARFARRDSTEENMNLLWSYLEKFGRPLAFYTDKASLFRTAQKHRRDEPGVEKDAVEMPPTQIGRALRELGITWIAAHSPQAKGRVERNFGTAQDRLVKGMRVAGVETLDQANRYLHEDYLAWWERELTVEPAHADDAHRRLDRDNTPHLAASLSHVETRQVRSDYTFRWEGTLYQIERPAVVRGMRGAAVRIERRLDGSMAVRYGETYLQVSECAIAERPAAKPVPVKRTGSGTVSGAERTSKWKKNFDLKKAPKMWQAAKGSGQRWESAT